MISVNCHMILDAGVWMLVEDPVFSGDKLGNSLLRSFL